MIDKNTKQSIVEQIAGIQETIGVTLEKLDNLRFDVEGFEVIPDPPPPPPDPEPEPEGRLLYSWDFKNGIPTGNLYFFPQNNGTATVVNDPAGGTAKVGALTIAKKTMNNNAAYLFFLRRMIPDFSITRWKVYVPKPTVSSWQWFNLWQAKVAKTDGSNTFAKWNFGILPGRMVVGYEPEKSSAGRTYIDLEFPYGRWVQVEVEYLKHLTRGIVAIKLDGVEIFRCEDKPTIEAARPDIAASIMNYSADYYSTVFVKDIELWTMT